MRKRAIGVCVVCVVAVGVVVFQWHSPGQSTPIESTAKPPQPAEALPAPNPNATEPTVVRASSATSPAKSPGASATSATKSPPFPLALEPDVSESIRLIAGQTTRKAYADRAATVHGLGKTLSRADVTGLIAFLESGLDSHPELDVLSLNALKNDALEVLIAQDTLPSDLLPAILDMYGSPKLDVLWRDYCLQHLALYYARRWKPDDATRLDEPDRQATLKAYEDALATTGNGFAGTALLGLARLSEQYPEIDRAKVAERSLASALNEQNDAATRITAMGLCGRLGQKDVLPTARIVAQTGENTPLRLASIGTIGLLGTSEDLELMESLAAGTDEAVRSAAKSAIKRLARVHP